MSTIRFISLSVGMSLVTCCACVRHAEARTPIRLANQPALSPDGSTLVFSWNGDLWSVDVNGGDARRLTHDPRQDEEPHFSPDGKRLAFVSNRHGSRQIYTMPAEGGVPEQVTFHTEGYQLRGWYPDGRSLLAIAARDHEWRHANRVYKINLERRQADEMVLDAHVADARLSPDASQMLLVREGERWWRKGYTGERAAQIWLYDFEHGAFTELLHERVDCLWPCWMRDGRGFYFAKGDHAGFNLFRYRFGNEADSTPNQQKVVDLSDDSVVFPTISADGQTIAFRHLFDFYGWRPATDAGPQKIEIFDPSDSLVINDQLRRMPSVADDVAFTADGLEVALVAGGDLWVMDTELREPVRVTTTPGLESSPRFHPNGEELWFVGTNDGQIDIWRAKRKDEKLPWWENASFELEQITNDSVPQSNLKFSPDGKRLFYVQGLGQIGVRSLEDGESRILRDGVSYPDYDVSADGQWIAYSVEDSNFNNDIWIAAVDGSMEPVNISRHPRNDYEPRFSPDGKRLAFTGQRDEGEIDVFYVNLQMEEDQTTSRQRRLEEARKKMERQRAARKGRGQGQTPTGTDNASSTDSSKDDNEKKNGDEDEETKRDAKTEPVIIDFDRIHERVRRVRISNSRERNLFWSHDGKQLLFQASINDRSGFYSITFPDELEPKFFSSTTGSNPVWTKDAKGVLLNSGGRPTHLDSSGKATSYAFTAYQELSRAAWLREGFDSAWRTMRDRWYDPNLGNRNWDDVRRKYREMAGQVGDPAALGQVIELMLGELNGSHLGFTPAFRISQAPRREGWDDVTAHLGVRFDPTWKGPGWKIVDVIPDSPADRRDSTLAPGEIILEVDGVAVDPAMDPALVLNGVLNRDIRLRVQPVAVVPRDGSDENDEKGEIEEQPQEENEAVEEEDEDDEDTVNTQTESAVDEATVQEPTGNEPTPDEEPAKEDTTDSDVPEEAPAPAERIVTIRPISFAQARRLLYDKWLDDNRRHVETVSQGKLGYLHIRGMDMRSFAAFQRELFNVGYGREGLIIDVRDNGGGSTTDLLLTALTQPRHAITVPRGGGPGYPHDRLVFASWHKPILVLCNQNSYSNAEIFSHAIKGLGRGKLVGVPTAGGVISTGSASVMDIGFVRMPFRAWFVESTGEDMEMNGAVPDVVLWPHPSDAAAGIDRQLDKGIELLLQDVDEFQKRPTPRLRWATER